MTKLGSDKKDWEHWLLEQHMETVFLQIECGPKSGCGLLRDGGIRKGPDPDPEVEEPGCLCRILNMVLTGLSAAAVGGQQKWEVKHLQNLCSWLSRNSTQPLRTWTMRGPSGGSHLVTEPVLFPLNLGSLPVGIWEPLQNLADLRVSPSRIL